MPALVAGVAAAALVVAGGIWFAVSGDESAGDSGTKEPPEARILHEIPTPKVGKDPIMVEGMWTTDRNFVKAGVNKVTGYPRAGGTAQWEIPLDGELCWTTPHISADGLTPVLFRDTDADNPVCTQVGLLDLRKGELRWQHEVTGEYGSRVMFDEVTMGGGTIAAGGSDGGAAWSVDGTALWKPAEDADCRDVGYGGGPRLVAVRRCGDIASPDVDVQSLDPRTRKAKSTYSMQTGVEYLHVVSTDPLVLAVEDERKQSTGVTDLLAVDDSGTRGTLRGAVEMGDDRYEIDCQPSVVESCAEVAVSKAHDAVFLATEQDVEAETMNEVVAFDLRTGKESGRTPGSADANLRVLGLDEKGAVLAYQETTLGGAGGAVWSVDPRTHRKRQLLRNGAAGRDTEASFEAGGQVHYARGHLYLGQKLISAPDDPADRNGPLAIVIGTT
ncbi:hypothetical protein [Streptomyces sp. NPDC057702]|uniref:hypothetical protein n=1 Tax=unclassified Streptomyces TaxID=2593676 RepID=UPI00368143D1